MFSIFAALFTIALAPADRVSEADLAAHIRVLASDEYEGRKPGTVASNKTLEYISTAWSRAGLRPGAADGGWYQPVALIDSAPVTTRLTLRGTRDVAIAAADVIGTGIERVQRLDGVRLVEVGPGVVPPDIAGKIAVLRVALVQAPGYSLGRHRTALIAAGAAGVLTLVPGSEAWATANRQVGQVSTALASAPRGLLLIAPAARFDAARAATGGETLTLSGEVTTNVRRYDSYNVVGRLPGRAANGETVAVIGHWDHLGICRPEGAPDRICNGAVDNASGIAVMIEVAERLVRGPRSARDVLFVATTAEESGLLGANAYVEAPIVPLGKIVALLNIDTIAIGPRGMPVSAVNRGNTAIDPLIDEIGLGLGRTLDTDLDANGFIQRQDGAAFTRAGVPAVMAGGSFADMPKLQAFLRSVYHGPDDEYSDALPLGGAAEDAELHVLLVRALADPARYTRKELAAPRP